MNRRRLLAAGTLAASRALPGLATLLAASGAAAADYPTKSVRVVYPFAAGSHGDLVARAISAKLTARLGQSFVVSNVPGAGGTIAANAAATAAPDGHTLFYTNESSLVIAPQLTGKPQPEPWKQFVPISPVLKFPLVLTARSEFPASDLAQMVAYAKANPGKINYASTGNGTTPHLVTEMLMRETGISMVHIPYKGSALAMQGLRTGEVDVFFELPVAVLPHVRAGTMKSLATTNRRRIALMPDVPTVSELGFPALTMESWSGVLAPFGTPAAIVDVLRTGINAAVAEPDIRELIVSGGLEPAPGSGDDLMKLVTDSWARWGSVIRSQKIVAN